MNPLVVAGFGTSINVDRRRLIIENRLEKKREEFLPFQIPYDSIIIDGNYGIVSFEAMRWLMSHKISLSLLNWNGNLMSVTLPREPISGNLKIRQYESYLDVRKRMYIAESIIKEKVRQSQNILKELSKYYQEIDYKKIESSFLNEYKFYERKGKNIGFLMNHEGRIADIYWDCLYKIFNKLYPEFNFRSRNSNLASHNRNASDEVNALLNYGYSVMDSEVRRTVNSLGLDYSIGFLHELRESRPSLICDLQELYRWLVDLSVIQLLEEKKLRKKDFIVTEHYHIRLREKTTKMLVEKIKSNFNNRALYKGANFTYENILYDNVSILANFIIGKRDKLEFNVPLVQLKRNDEIDQKDRILSIGPEERKRLGINKSTLWYQQKHIKEGKRIKLYGKTKEILND
jgi:CRISPR-associated protein Cas1